VYPFFVLVDFDFVEQIDLMEDRFNIMISIGPFADDVQTEVNFGVCAELHVSGRFLCAEKYVNNAADARMTPRTPIFDCCSFFS
jgi:hypothetical protein